MRKNNSVHAANSREWWDNYFVDQWDANKGSDQTYYFMERLLANLPAPEIAYLCSRPLHILDWGCAFGEGVELLAQTFPQSLVVGLDFALRAIEGARQRYPGHKFILTEDGEIPGEFDVIVTSNCLEHFEKPLEVMMAHLRSCRKLYIALVPYNEFPLSEYHRSQFREESFPERLKNFVRLDVKQIDVDPVYWNGKQLLVLYGSRSYLQERTVTSYQELEQEKWDKYYASLPLVDEDEALRIFNSELVERVAELLPPASRILEAGCGGGWQSLALARSGKFQVNLMDFSHEALAYTRRLFEQEKLSAEFIDGDIFTHGKPDFDLVFNAGVLEHYTFEEQVAFLRGMASRSRKYILVLVPNRLCYWYWLWRVQKSGEGEWPFGKEVPLVDLSAAFEAASLHFLGQTFMGETWAESFINSLSGMDKRLRDEILEIHRSPLIPKGQKCYLTATLGSVSTEVSEIPRIWTKPSLAEDMQRAEISAALADALALRIGAERRLNQLQVQVVEGEQAVQGLQGQLAERDRAVADLQAQVTDALALRIGAERRLNQLQVQVVEGEQAVQGLQGQLAERDRAVADLQAQVTEREHQVQALQAQMAAVASSTGWALLQMLWRIRLWVAPHGSLREQVLRLGVSVGRVWKREGFGALMHKAVRRGLKGGLTKRIRGLRARLFWGIRRRLPQPVKRSARSLLAQIRKMQSAWAGKTHTHQVPLVAQLAEILAQHQIARDVIIFAPSVHWNLPLFQRPHQLALAFARLGCLVFFCEPPYSEDYPTGFHSITQGLYVANAPIDLFKAVESPIVIVLPYNLFDWDCLSNARCVYDYIDELDIFTGDRQVLEQNHQTLLRTATLVVATAERLWRHVVAFRPDVLLCPNGVDYPFIRQTVETTHQPPDDLSRVLRSGAPVIGYYGALAEWFDYELVMRAAAARPEYEFVLIGPDYDGSLAKSRIENVKNICWLGVRSYAQLPRYLKYFDVATIPFKLSKITHSTSPVKLFEYMAGGKPVVTTAMHESARFESVLVARDAEDFVRKLDEALKLRTDPEYLCLIDRVARENTWDVRAQQILEALSPRDKSIPVHLRCPPGSGQTEAGRGTAVIQADEVNTGSTRQSLELREEASAPASLVPRGTRFLELLRERFQFGRLDEIDDPTKRMWVEFALSTNERGRIVAGEVGRYTRIGGKKFLDAGCAYGGFLVAFAAKGAERVIGIDINPHLLRLAAANLEDCNVSASLYLRDLLDPEILGLGRFDIITCNDVIEHVEDPRKAISHLSLLLEDGGLLYMEIPNKYFIGFLKEDGHYRLPGITLLPRQRAARYHFLNFGDTYGVGFYRKLDYYLYHLVKHGLSPILINQEVGIFNSGQLDSLFQEALRSLQSFQGKHIEPALAEEIRRKGGKLYDIFIREVEAYQALRRQNPERAPDLARRIHHRYGIDFWKVVALKQTAVKRSAGDTADGRGWEKQ